MSELADTEVMFAAVRPLSGEAAELLETLPEAAVVVGSDWRFRYANGLARQALDAREMVGEDIFEHFPGNREEPFGSAYRRAMRERVAVEFEAFHPAPLNVWVKVQTRPFEDGIIVFFTDVTARHEAEDRERRTAARLAEMLEVTSDAVVAMDRGWNFTFLNKRAHLLLDPAGREMLGRNLWEELPRIAEMTVARVLRCSMAGEHTDSTEVFYGEPLNAWLVLQSHPAPQGIVVFFRDVTERKRSEERLQVEQQETERQRVELETIYKTSPVGLALLDSVEFRFLNLNDHEAAMLGYPKEEILGKRLSEIAPPASIPGLEAMMRSVAQGNSIADRLLEGELKARPGERRAWSVNYSPVYDEAGEVRAISTASIEITNQKKSEAALIQSEKLAAVGRLASSISHEINNPLEAITNLLYLIATDKALPDPLKGLVHMAQSELGRVSQIATQTLRFHRQAVNPTQVTAEGLVGAVIQLYTGRLANSHIKVDARYDTQTEILCFENDIRQVLNNLIANAIDAMRRGGRLLVRAHESTDRVAGPGLGRKGVRITIADNGHGMNRATLRRVFEPFFTTKDLQGTGLGLWISAGIVERHQGRLQVRSTDDAVRHGTVFTLFLPCEEVRTV